MIDYEKLKLAHELIQKYAFEKEWDINLSACFDSFKKERFGWILSDGNGDYRFNNLDDLIAKLCELMGPKYKVGETWWYLDEASFIRYPQPKSILITEENKNWYRADEEWHPTKLSLIRAQIQYWHKLEDDLKTDE